MRKTEGDREKINCNLPFIIQVLHIIEFCVTMVLQAFVWNHSGRLKFIQTLILSDQPVKAASLESGQTHAAHASHLCLYERSTV